MYNDYYLKANTEIGWYRIATKNGLMSKDDDGNYYANSDYAIDIIGFVMDEEGNKKEGFLVNIRTKEDLSEMVLPFIEPPLTPVRVWF